MTPLSGKSPPAWRRWGVLGAAAVLVACAGVRLVTLPGRAAEALRRLVADDVAGTVTLGRVSLAGLGEVHVHGITWQSETVGGSKILLRAEKARVRCGILSLFTPRATIRAIRLGDVEVRLSLPPDGTWDLAGVLKRRTDIGWTPRIVLSRARLTIQGLTLPDGTRPAPFSAARMGLESPERGRLDLDAAFRHPRLGEWTLNATLDTRTGALSGRISGSGATLGRELAALLPASVRSLWEQAGFVSGRADLRLTFDRRSSDDGRSPWRGTFSIRDGVARPPGLRGSISDVSLDGCLDPERLTLSFRGRAGTGAVRGGGCVLLLPRGPELELTAEVSRLPLPMVVAPSEKTPAARAFRSLHLAGEVEGDVRLHGVLGEGRPAVEATLALRGARAHPERLPAPIRDIGARLLLREGRLLVFDASGRYGAAMLTVPYARLPLVADEAFDVAVRFSGLALTPDLKALLPRGWLETFGLRLWPHVAESALSGLADGTYRLSRVGGTAAVLKHEVAAKIRGGLLSSPGLPAPLRDIEGTVRAGNDFISLRGVQGRLGGRPVAVDHLRIVRTGPAGRGRLSGRIRGLAVHAGLVRALPDDLRVLAQRYGLEGACDLEMMIQAGQEGRGEERRLLKATLNDARLRLPGLPDAIREVRGTVTLRGPAVVAADFKARVGTGWLRLQIGGASRAAAQAVLTVEGLALGEGFAAGLPEPWAARWLRIAPRGNVDLVLRITADGSDRPANRLTLGGHIILDGVSLREDLHVSDLRGRFEIRQAAVDRRTGSWTMPHLSGKVVLEGLVLGGKRLSDCEANVRLDRGVLSVDDCRAACYTGRLQGWLRLPWRPGASPGERGFEISLGSEGVDAAALARDVVPEWAGLSGRVATACRSRRAAASDAAWSGQGDLRVREARVDRLPGAKEVLEFFRLPKAAPPAFTAARYEYNLEGERVVPVRMELSGPQVALRGRVRPGTLEARAATVSFTPTLTRQGAQSAAVREVAGLLEQREVSVKLGASPEEPLWRLDPALSLARLGMRLSSLAMEP